MSARHSRTSSQANTEEEVLTTLENKSMAMYEESLSAHGSNSQIGESGRSGRPRGYSSIKNQSYRDGGGSDTDSMVTVEQTGGSNSINEEDTPPPVSPTAPRGARRKASSQRDEHSPLNNNNTIIASTSSIYGSSSGKGSGATTEHRDESLGTERAIGVPSGILGLLLGHQAAGPHAYKLIASFVTGFVLLSLATLGIKIWHTATWFHDPGPFAQNSWAGYTGPQYFGLLLFTLCSTTGFSLFYVPLTIAGRYRSSHLALVLLLSFAVLCFVVGIIAISTWGHPMMHCLGFFCVGPEGKWSHTANSRPSSGFGFLVVIGTSACFSLCPAALVMTLQFYDRLFSPLSHCKEDQNGDKKKGEKYRGMHQLSRPNNKSRILTALMIFVFLLFFFAATTWIPNSWEYFTANQIADNGRIRETMSFLDCNNNYNLWTCGELPWATFVAKNLKVKADLYMKIYPANVFFYVYMVSVLLFIVGARCVKPGRLFLKTEVKLIRSIISLTYGELVVSSATTLMLFLFSWYWFHDHNFNGSYLGISPPFSDAPEVLGIAPSERYARAFGQLAVCILSLLLFPASRNSVIHRLFGTSWEASLWAHKVLGWGMISATIAHVVAWYVKYHQIGIFPKAIFSLPTALPESIDNFTVPIISVAVLVLLISTIFLTYDGIRRGWFELFYYPHLFAAYLIIPTALWHAAAGWEYMLPGVTVWFIDRLIRMYRSGSEVLITEVRLHEDTTEIRFQCPNMKVKAGQYVFINIPEISLFEWHPFTLSSGAGSSHFSVHIKAMYDGSWTARLLALMEQTSERGAAAVAKNGGGNNNNKKAYSLAMETVITLAVDGPYGHSYDFEDYDRVILVCGGIGVTPVASIYQTLQREAPNIEVLALWSTRKLSSLEAFRDQLEAPVFDPYNDSSSNKRRKCMKVFLTKSTDDERLEAKEKEKTFRNVEIGFGRPDIEESCRTESSLPESCTTLLFVCGPLPLVEDAREVAREFDYHFHAETFFL